MSLSYDDQFNDFMYLTSILVLTPILVLASILVLVQCRNP